jgi:hypothetical protein
MQKPAKVLLGLATLWPFAYMILFFAFIFLTILLGRGGPPDNGMPAMFAMIFGLHILTMLIIVALTVFYIVNVFKNDRVNKDQKALWAIVIFLGNMIAMPIYWYLYIWREPAIAGQPAAGQLNSMDSASWTNEARTSGAEQRQYVPPPQPPNWRE